MKRTEKPFCAPSIFSAPMQKFLAIAAWTALAIIVFLTVSPLELRPDVTADPNVERFVAFAVVGILFGLAYPRRLIFDASLVVIAAGVLEAFQLITRDRHGHVADAFVKAAGGAFGVAMALMILIMLERRKVR